jgi:sarcosine oxidase delta subunit
MKEQSFSTGTWSGAVLTGHTCKCGGCSKYFVVTRDVLSLGASIYNATGCRDLTCPYCAETAPVTLDNGGRILEDHSVGPDY